jgi:hypothetical protein
MPLLLLAVVDPELELPPDLPNKLTSEFKGDLKKLRFDEILLALLSVFDI